MTSPSPLDNILLRRGILKAARDLGWQAHKIYDADGWLYPVYDLIGDALIYNGKPLQRWKNADSAAKDGRKCMWCYDGQPKPHDDKELNAILPSLYVPFDLDKAFVDSCADHGTLYLVSGEPDTLAMRQAGFLNTTCCFGETNIPANLKDLLAKAVGLGQGDVVKLYPDADDTGLGWAQNIARLLAPHGIAVEVYRLPYDRGSKGDLNRLWMDCNFEITDFTEALKACPPMIRGDLIPAKPLYQKRTDRPPEGSTTKSLREAGVYKRVAEALGVERYNPDGRSQNIKCPFHDDTKPSAVWWDNSVDEPNLMCFVCGWHGAKETIERLGIGRPHFTPSKVPSHSAENAGTIAPAQVIKRDAKWLYMNDISNASFLTMPYREIAALGGFCRQMELGKMMAVIGVSGGQKTTFLENVYWSLAEDGHPGAVYSPEWSGSDTLLRQIQRLGGPSYIRTKEHLAYHYETQRGRTHEWATDHYMVPFTPTEQETFDRLLAKIRATPGKIFEIPHHYSFEETKLDFINAAVTARDMGQPLRWIVVDYIQLLAHEYGAVMDAIAWLKDFCMVQNCFGLVASQMVKSASAEVRRGEKPIGGEGMEYAKDNAFNSGLVLSAEFDDTGMILPWIKVNVVKNSLGRTRQQIKLSYNPGRLLITDPGPDLKYGSPERDQVAMLVDNEPEEEHLGA